MAKVFIPDNSAFAELRCSSEVKAMIDGLVKDIKVKAEGQGCECVVRVKTSQGAKGRAWGQVMADGMDAKRINAKTNALVKALGSTKL